MTPLVTLPMESYQLAKYAEPLVCFVCEFENNYDAEICRCCGAPMALTHQAGNYKTAPQMIAVVGPPKSGKTVYLGMLLDLLARRTSGIRALARGAFSVTLQQQTVESLATCQFPEATPSAAEHWNWVHCQVHLAGRQVQLMNRRSTREIVFVDSAGDAQQTHLDNEQYQPAVSAMLARSAAALVVVDVTQVESGGSDAEYFAVKALSNLAELPRTKKGRTAWQKRPVAVVFTKADGCEICCDDPTSYADRHCSGLAQFCRDRFSKVAFFATSVARSTTTRYGEDIPLRIEPRGIVEPFEWLTSRMRR